MPSTTRRTVLASLGAVALGGASGCASLTSDDPPAGSLRFRNDHVLPHAITMRVAAVGSSPGDRPGDVGGEATVPPAQRTLAASTVVDPGATQTYDAVFTEPVWYAVRFAVDGRTPADGRLTFHPAPSDDERGTMLTARVSPSGEFSWIVSATGNAGPFGR